MIDRHAIRASRVWVSCSPIKRENPTTSAATIVVSFRSIPGITSPCTVGDACNHCRAHPASAWRVTPYPHYSYLFYGGIYFRHPDVETAGRRGVVGGARGTGGP